MLFLFCSAAVPLYKRDALRSIAYPKGHVFRFRYAEKYVAPGIFQDLQKPEGGAGILIFADTVGATGAADFAFYPVRTVEMIRLVHQAGAIYVDFRFGDFVNYGTDDSRKSTWDGFLKKLDGRPWPPSSKSGRPPNQEGYFLLAASKGLQGVTTDSRHAFENWNSVVNH